MYPNSAVFFSVLLSTIFVSVDARYAYLERDGKVIYLARRRFDQQNPQLLQTLAGLCPGQVCGTLSGQAVSPLLADADECAQQNIADQIIDAAAQFDATTKTNMINLAVQYRQLEKNTPPDFTTNPPTNRNSVFCQTAPKNSQLNGLVQAQDPANDPNAFFDPALGKTVLKGSQANTFPFGTSGSSSSSSGSKVVSSQAPAVNTAVANPCPEPVTVTVTAASESATTAVSSSSSSSSSSGSANLQTFQGALGGVTAPPVTAIGSGQFQVTGNAQFNNLANALERSCDVQHNKCADQANATGNKGDLTVDACGQQQTECDNNSKA